MKRALAAQDLISKLKVDLVVERYCSVPIDQWFIL
jgi:hypothetical protein